jgi:hypothetical protein
MLPKLARSGRAFVAGKTCSSPASSLREDYSEDPLRAESATAGGVAVPNELLARAEAPFPRAKRDSRP